MERLTYRDEKGTAIKEQAENKTEDVWNCIERLCELEDMMEDGRLVELPCKIGDTVYVPSVLFCDGYTGQGRPFGEVIRKIVEEEVKDKLDQVRLSYAVLKSRAYFTREEAEAKLREMNNEAEAKLRGAGQ